MPLDHYVTLGRSGLKVSPLCLGTATFGDMGCHIYDPVFAGLQLTAPISVRSEGKILPQSQIVASLKAANRLSKAIDKVARKLHPEVLRQLVFKGVTPETLKEKSRFETVLAEATALSNERPLLSAVRAG